MQIQTSFFWAFIALLPTFFYLSAVSPSCNSVPLLSTGILSSGFLELLFLIALLYCLPWLLAMLMLFSLLLVPIVFLPLLTLFEAIFIASILSRLSGNWYWDYQEGRVRERDKSTRVENVLERKRRGKKLFEKYVWKRPEKLSLGKNGSMAECQGYDIKLWPYCY